MGEENIQKAVKTAIDAAEAALSEGEHFCVTHVDVGLDATTVREAVVKAMNRFKVSTTVQFCLKLFASSGKLLIQHTLQFSPSDLFLLD